MVLGISSSCKNIEPSEPSITFKTPQKLVTSWPNRCYVRSVEDVKRIAKNICGEKSGCEVQCKSPLKVAKRKPMVNLPPKGFSRSQLVRLKYLMPEAIDIRTTLVRDETTNDVKPVPLVALRPDALKEVIRDSYLVLSREVRSQLATFIKSRLEGDEILEETLPEPFNQRTQSIQSEAKLNGPFDTTKDLLISSASSSLAETIAQSPLGCLTNHFQKCLSQKAIIPKCDKTNLLSLPTPNTTSVDDISSVVASSPNNWRSLTKQVVHSI